MFHMNGSPRASIRWAKMLAPTRPPVFMLVAARAMNTCQRSTRRTGANAVQYERVYPLVA